MEQTPLAPFLAGLTPDYSNIESQLITERAIRHEVLAICKEYCFSPNISLDLANQFADDELNDEEWVIRAEPIVQEYILSRHDKDMLGTEYKTGTNRALGIQDLVNWGFSPEAAEAIRGAVGDVDWMNEALSFWVDSLLRGDCRTLPMNFPYLEDKRNEWFESSVHPGLALYNIDNPFNLVTSSADSDWTSLNPVLSSNPRLATIIANNITNIYALYFHACSWSNAYDIIQTTDRLPLRPYIYGQDFGLPLSASFYTSPSIRGAVERLIKNVHRLPGPGGSSWMSQGAFLIFCVEVEALNKLQDVVDVGSGDAWAELMNVRSVCEARDFESAKAVARPHAPPQLQAAVKDDHVGELFRNGLVGVLWYGREAG
ncbi:hypothetical protein HDV00_002771 [Rhizophlyctis rosea]|nr:hypothetical protein HDV00_002771 [Rhizophlyctis rosea]